MSAIGRLALMVFLGVLFFASMAGVVYMSLQGREVSVPEITGKQLNDGEAELASLGLKMKKRAERFSDQAPGTVIEQLPKPGETVKTGQLILVVTSKGAGEGMQLPSTLKNATEEDDTEKIEEMISDKPKKPKANTNSNRKKADTARDVNAEGNAAGEAPAAATNSAKKDVPGEANKPSANTQRPAANRPAAPAPTRPAANRPRTDRN